MTVSDDVRWNSVESQPYTPSSLYHLEPIGLGTPFVESLTSMLKRLAHIHQVKLSDLVAFCASVTQDEAIASTPYKLFWIDSVTNSAKAWSRLLNQLTHNDVLQYLTMGYFQPMLNSYQLLRSHQAWCPACYAHWAQSGEILYEPLLWRLRAVDVCLIHHCELVDRCPACNATFKTITQKAIVGFCPKCHAWLGDETQSSASQASIATESPQRIQAIGHLLSIAPQMVDFHPDMIPQVIEIVKQKKNIPYTHLEVELQIRTSALSNLKAEKRSINLNTLVRLALISDGILWQMLSTGEITEPVVCESNSPCPHITGVQRQTYLDSLLASPEPLPVLKDITQRCGFAQTTHLRAAFPAEYATLRRRIHNEQRRALQDILDGDEMITVTELARQRGYYQGDLYHWFPDLCVQVTQVVRERQKAKCHRYLNELIANDTYPSLKAISRTLGVGSYYLSQRFPQELATIAVARQRQKQQEYDRVRCYLDEILASDTFPPPALHAIAQQLGKSPKSLKKTFPIQTRKLLDRYRNYLVENRQEKCDRIRQEVFTLHEQGIYPSVDRLHNISKNWMIHGSPYRDAYIEAMHACGYKSI